MNANMMIESEMLTSTLEREMRKLIMRAQREVLEVCAKEYKIDINAAMLLVNAGMERKVAKNPTASGIAKKATAIGIAKVERKSKGRPKNPEKEVEVEETENLFEQLVNTHLEEEVECSAVFQTKEETKAEKSAEKEERGLMSGEEKDTKVANKAEAKAAASAIAKLAKEAEKLAKIEAKEAEKLAKEAEKLAKIEAKEAEKLAKEAEKATASAIAKEATASAIAAKEQAKLAKDSAKASASGSDTSSKSVKKARSKKTKEPTASSGIASNKTKETAERVAKESNDVEYQAKMTEMSKKLEAAAVMPVAVVSVMASASSKEPTASGIVPATLKVKSFKFEGATYFREKTTGAIYDKESNDHLGQWNEASQKIDFLEPEEELEEEDESAGESSDEEDEEEEEESA
jgi:hypothetical protein